MASMKKRVSLGVMLIVVVCLATSYYNQDLFPIGFTGFEHTGYWGGDGSPYPDDPDDYPYGTWEAESLLLAKTHCNFIGLADGLHIFDKNITLNYNSFKSQTL